MNEARIENQMDILADDVKLTSAAGTMKGKENYPERLAVYKGWLNAHHVQDIKVVEKENTLNLEANIRYQNVRPDGTKKAYSIHYSTLLNNEGRYPVFSNIEIVPTGESYDEYNDAYPNNRCKSLMHAWLANMEMMGTETEPFMELLSEEFKLNFTSGLVDSEESLLKWLSGPPSKMKQTSHHPEALCIDAIDESHFQLEVEFDWYGITSDDKQMCARTKHSWQIVDNPEERFARIAVMDVEILEPFRFIEG